MLVVRYLVIQPTDLIAETPDGCFQHLHIIRKHLRILPNLSQRKCFLLYAAHRFHGCA